MSNAHQGPHDPHSCQLLQDNFDLTVQIKNEACELWARGPANEAAIRAKLQQLKDRLPGLVFLLKCRRVGRQVRQIHVANPNRELDECLSIWADVARLEKALGLQSTPAFPPPLPKSEQSEASPKDLLNREHHESNVPDAKRRKLNNPSPIKATKRPMAANTNVSNLDYATQGLKRTLEEALTCILCKGGADFMTGFMMRVAQPQLPQAMADVGHNTPVAEGEAESYGLAGPNRNHPRFCLERASEPVLPEIEHGELGLSMYDEETTKEPMWTDLRPRSPDGWEWWRLQ